MTAPASADATGLSAETSATARPAWRVGRGQTAGATVAVLLAGLALVFGRVEFALLALPVIASCAWAWDRRPSWTEVSTVSLTTDRIAAASGPELTCTLTFALPARIESVDLRVATLGGEPRQIRVVPPALRAFTLRAPVLHSGPQVFFELSHRLFGGDGSAETAPIGPLLVRRTIAPPQSAITSLPVPHRLPGAAGPHDSARPGDGGDFRDIHSFTAGDRLRRIDWKATARRGRFPGDLYVRRSAATAEATVFLVLDSRDDVGEQVSEWSRNRPADKGISSLDYAREAAAAIAAGYIRGGDRVGFQDLANTNRVVAPGGGSRHLLRVLRSIELTAPTKLTSAQRLRPPPVTTGALIYVLSSFLDDEAARLGTWWTGSGHRVIAVDVLPPAQLGRTTRYDRLAHQIVMMQRAERLLALEAYGVDVLHWAGSVVGRNAHLRSLSRPGRGRR